MADTCWEGSETICAEMLLSLCLSPTNLGLLLSLALFDPLSISLEGNKFIRILSLFQVYSGILYFWFIITRKNSQKTKQNKTPHLDPFLERTCSDTFNVCEFCGQGVETQPSPMPMLFLGGVMAVNISKSLTPKSASPSSLQPSSQCFSSSSDWEIGWPHVRSKRSGRELRTDLRKASDKNIVLF